MVNVLPELFFFFLNQKKQSVYLYERECLCMCFFYFYFIHSSIHSFIEVGICMYVCMNVCVCWGEGGFGYCVCVCLCVFGVEVGGRDCLGLGCVLVKLPPKKNRQHTRLCHPSSSIIIINLININIITPSARRRRWCRCSRSAPSPVVKEKTKK